MMKNGPIREQEHMIARPSDLPDFAEPPLVEVVLGIQFERVKGLGWVHLGPLWEAFRSEFPNFQEQPPLQPAFETFGIKRASKSLSLELFTGPIPLPRLWFLDEAQNRLLQFQPDRFIHNWRKVQEGDDYPRYEQIREDFCQKVSDLSTFLKENGLGELHPNQCEVTYVNHIPSIDGEELLANPHKVLKTFENIGDVTAQNQLEDSRCLLRFVINSAKGTPIGRLIVESQAVFSNDNEPLIRLTLSAKGQPESQTFESALEFIDSGREGIVRAFADLTTNEMHQRWGRRS